MTEVEQPPQNGIDLSAAEDDDNNKARPADIEQDMREMERRKRVEAIMGSKLFREELERIVDSARDSGATGILQQLSDIVGVPSSRVGSVFKASNCLQPINDIRGVESMGYAKGEKILRCKLAAAFRLLDLYGWTQGLGAQITARLKVDQEYFLVNPYGLLYHEITASSLNKVDMQGNVVEQGTTNFGVNKSHFVLHSIVHAARPDIRCAIYIGCSPVVAISSLKTGLLPLTKDACVLGEVTTFQYTGSLYDEDERNKLVRHLGPNSKVMLLNNHGALCCGETIEEAFYAACHIVQACETQLKLLPIGVDNLVLIPEESRKIIYEQSRRPPEDLEKKFAALAGTNTENNKDEESSKKEETATTKVIGQAPKWRVGGAEFEALMRMLDNAGYRTGYIYRHPLIKSEPPKPKNDVELPPAVSSLGYLLEEEELYRQGIWKKGALGKGGDRSRWLNSPNVYQKVEVLETGTPDPKKITKWVAEGSPTHSTPVRIDDPLQFVPVNTNPKEFKRLQQQIKDNRRADKISAGPQSHILEGVTWDEANRIKDATVSSAGDHVVLMGAASKGIIQRGFQHNATVYKAPYAKNPFDNVTDDELNEYKRTVERKKKSIHGEYTDTDFSESEALSSLQTSGAQQTKQTTTTTTAAVSQSEPEDMSEHQVMRIETQQAPVPSQPEVVLSDASLSFINGERSHTSTNRKPPTGRDLNNNAIYQDSLAISKQITQEPIPDVEECAGSSGSNIKQINQENHAAEENQTIFHEMHLDTLFQKQKEKNTIHTPKMSPNKALALAKENSTNRNVIMVSPCSSPRPLPMESSFYDTPYSHLLSKSCPSNLCSFSTVEDENVYYSIQETVVAPTAPVFAQVNSNTTIYDYPYDFPKNTFSQQHQKSLLCCTPQTCNSILEALAAKSKPKSFSYCSSVASITPENQNSPRKPTRVDTPIKLLSNRNFSRTAKTCCPPTKAVSPYRTNSHFGFNSPTRTAKPQHKHLPLDVPKRQQTLGYIPLTRSISYEDIFSSPRYLELCENCFEQIVRMKPELQLLHQQIKLKNLMDMAGPGQQQQQQPAKTVADTYLSTDQDVGAFCFAYEDTAFTGSAFTSQLEPLMEVEERDSSEDPLNIAANSTFLDKISRMNYSEESTNFQFIKTPHAVSTDLTLAEFEARVSPFERDANQVVEKEEHHHQQNALINENLSKQLQNLSLQEIENVNEEARANAVQYSGISITEIVDFNNWLLNARLEEQEQNNFQSQENENNFENKANKLCSAQPKLMSREERTRRKLQFQQDWQYHITELETHEQTLSDTESAIHQAMRTNSNSPLSTQSSLQAGNDNGNFNSAEEIFHGRSFIIPHNVCELSSNKGAIKKSIQNAEEDVMSSSSSIFSQKTYDVISAAEQPTASSSSSEYYLFRKYGCTNINETVTVHRIGGLDMEQASAVVDNSNNGIFRQKALSEHGRRYLSDNKCANETKNMQKEVTSHFYNVRGDYDVIDEVDKAMIQNRRSLLETNCEKETKNMQKDVTETTDFQYAQKDSNVIDEVEKLMIQTRRSLSTNCCPNKTKNMQEDFAQTADFQYTAEEYDVLDDVEKLIIPNEDHLGNIDYDIQEFEEFERIIQDQYDSQSNITECFENLVQQTGQSATNERVETADIIIIADDDDDDDLNRLNNYQHLDEMEKEKDIDNISSKMETLANTDALRKKKSKAEGHIWSFMENSFKDQHLENDNDIDSITSKIDSCSLQKNKSQSDGHICSFMKHSSMEQQNKNDIIIDSNIQKESKTQQDYKFELKKSASEHKWPSKAVEISLAHIWPYIDNNSMQQHAVNKTSIDSNFWPTYLTPTDCELKKSASEHLLPNMQYKSKEQLSQSTGKLEVKTAKLNSKNCAKANNQVNKTDSAAQCNNDQKYSSLERKILEKIQVNQLNKSEEIFDKIECTIRNKRTASNLELLIKQQALNLCSDLADTAATSANVATSFTVLHQESEKLRKFSSYFNLKHLVDDSKNSNKQHSKRSKSLTPTQRRRNVELSPSVAKTCGRQRNKSLTPTNRFSQTKKKNKPNEIQVSSSCCSPSPNSSLGSLKSSTSQKKRNFILENIRNAAIPVQHKKSPYVKRLGNPQAIFCKNPFGPTPPVTPKSSCSSSLHNYKYNRALFSREQSPASRSSYTLNSKTCRVLPSPSNSSCSSAGIVLSPHAAANLSTASVYSFQSKLVKGSPKFWVSLCKSPKKQQNNSSSPQLQQTKSLYKFYAKSPRTDLAEALDCSNTLQCNEFKASNESVQELDNTKTISHEELKQLETEVNIDNETLTEPVEALHYLEQHGEHNDQLTCFGNNETRVDKQITALGKEIQQIQPRLETYKRKLNDFGDRVAKCARNMDECVATQESMLEEQRDFRERMELHQYLEDIICRVQTFSLSETED